jgi:hypothetical protein
MSVSFKRMASSRSRAKKLLPANDHNTEMRRIIEAN